MRKFDPVVVVCFFAYLASYIPLIYLSNSAGVPPLAVLPVSTFVSCVCAVVITILTGWWRTWEADNDASRAAFQASPFTAMVLSLVPLAYAIAQPAAILPTVIMMKVGSLLVTLSRGISGARSTLRAKLAVASCAAIVCVAAAGKLFAGGSIAMSLSGLLVAGLYVASYAGRLRAMSGHKKSIAYFSLEHLAAPFIALAGMLFASFWSKDLALGFTLWGNGKLWLLGLCSQAAGLAGGWILVGRQLSSAAMVINRSAAILAGVALVLMQGCRLDMARGFEFASAVMVPVVLAMLPSEPAQVHK